MKRAASLMRLIWQVFWPVLLIEVLNMILLLVLSPAWDLQMITIGTDLLAFAFLYPFYRCDGRRRTAAGKIPGQPGRDAVFLAVFAAASCIALNELIRLLGIESMSGRFEETNEILFSGGIWVQILLMSAAAPLAEELIFRGLCYERLREHLGAFGAGLCSALWFGVFHGNLVQGVYGFCMGLLLALVYERYRGLSAAVLFHACANLTSILISEGMNRLPGTVPPIASASVMIVAAIVSGICIRAALRRV